MNKPYRPPAMLALFATAVLVAAPAASEPAPDDESSGPICEGRDLAITRLDAATDFAVEFCACGGDQPGCVEDMTLNFLFTQGDMILCGPQLPQYEQCVIDFAACGQPAPLLCWELLGWVFD